jgi:hypothetical protein
MAQHTNHTSAADPCMHLKAQMPQCLRDQLRCAMFGESKFRMGMQIVSERNQIRQQIIDFREHGINRLLRLRHVIWHQHGRRDFI